MKAADELAVPLTRQPISNKAIDPAKMALAGYWL